MDKADGDLFIKKQQCNDSIVSSMKKNEKNIGKEVNIMPQQGIVVNKKLELYLEKYINSFNELHEKIEMKGILIDLIRKL